MITAKQLHALLSYDPKTGIFVWLVDPPRGTKRAGKVAGSAKQKTEKLSYVDITIKGTQYGAHVLAVLYMTGTLPKNHVDHKDGNGLNNKWNNLREATNSENLANASSYSTNTSGARGVTWNKRLGRWQAQIKFRGKNIYLGLFDKIDDAQAAYSKKAIELFGEFAKEKACD